MFYMEREVIDNAVFWQDIDLDVSASGNKNSEKETEGYHIKYEYMRDTSLFMKSND